MPAVTPTRGDCVGFRTRFTEAPDVGDAQIANLLQEAFEEDAADRKLTRIVTALGLLLASLHASGEDRAYADTDASAARTR